MTLVLMLVTSTVFAYVFVTLFWHVRRDKYGYVSIPLLTIQGLEVDSSSNFLLSLDIGMKTASEKDVDKFH